MDCESCNPGKENKDCGVLCSVVAYGSFALATLISG